MARVREAFPGGAADTRLWHVPGRVELLGKHTDYAGGRSLLVACERGLVIGMRPRQDAEITFLDAGTRTEARFALDPALAPRVGHWSAYPMTVARRLARNFPGARRGADLVLASDLPSAAGLSSSSALVVATFLALAEANGLAATTAWQAHLATPAALAGYLGCVENGQDFGPLSGELGVGTFGGSQDHTAILCCRGGFASQYRFCPVTFEEDIPWPTGQVVVVGVSGVRARKTGPELAKYNRLSLATRQAVERWREHSGSAAPTLAAAIAEAGVEAVVRSLESDPGAGGEPTEFLVGRVRQFAAESLEIIPAAGAALARGDLGEFGRQVDRSQGGAETGLGNQVPETVALARAARELGAHAASAFGAGFGGSVWAMVDGAQAGEFARRWIQRHKQAFPRSAKRAEAFTTLPGPAARELP